MLCRQLLLLHGPAVFLAAMDLFCSVGDYYLKDMYFTISKSGKHYSLYEKFALQFSRSLNKTLK